MIPDIKKPLLGTIEPFQKSFNELKNIWRKSRESVKVMLENNALNGKVYGALTPDENQSGISRRQVKVMSLIRAMDRFVDDSSTGFPLFEDFEKFTLSKIKSSTRKKSLSPVHQVFDICENFYLLNKILQKEMDRYIIFLKKEFLRYAKTELFIRKKKKNILFFDDLLLYVEKGLEKKGKNPLLDSVRGKYLAALIDEFQDTDSVQYKIFSRLFNSKNHILFMIGDPKQSIYGFRGADIFSYMNAASNADSKFTLLENWRSEPGLITAVNTIFSNKTEPFIFNKITFQKAVPGITERRLPDNFRQPFTIRYLSSETFGEKGKPVRKQDAVLKISDDVAEEIACLISSEGERESDIAVLVRTNRQAGVIKQCLSSRNIPSVLYNSDNIFDSHEALEMEWLLASVSDPNNLRTLKTAMVTDMLGVTCENLDAAGDDPVWWEMRILRFNEYFNLLNKHGFIRMFGLLMRLENIRERILLFPDGERRLTNILHLAEILQQVSLEKKIGPTGLAKWLSEQRDPLSSRLEEDQLRLESDENAVNIVTIHKSKGLEYKIVFCPFAWEGSTMIDNDVFFHDTSPDRTLVLDIGSDKKGSHLLRAQKELLAENLRILYVALTRAKSRCYLSWGRINTAQTSAVSYLFHHRDVAFTDDVVTTLKKTFSIKKDKDLLDDLRYLEDNSENTIKLTTIPVTGKMNILFPGSKSINLCKRKFSGKIDTTWKISSYSSMVTKHLFESDAADYDKFADYFPGESADYSESVDKKDIFSFPGGAHSGIFFHDIFERLDFVRDDALYRKTFVTDKLKEYQFDSCWENTVCKMVKNVLSTPLFDGDDKLLLSSVTCDERINEMEFYFPLKMTSGTKLKEIFTNYGGNDTVCDFSRQLGKLAFFPAKGYMKGYIDMIFFSNGRYYLVDWKSNFLGNTMGDYNRKRLDKIMQKDYYILQYHLYTLALHQYLKTRMQGYGYEKDFGGVFYIFIKGVDPEYGPEFGIYRDKPGKSMIDKLGKALIPDYRA